MRKLVLAVMVVGVFWVQKAQAASVELLFDKSASVGFMYPEKNALGFIQSRVITMLQVVRTALVHAYEREPTLEVFVTPWDESPRETRLLTERSFDGIGNQLLNTVIPTGGDTNLGKALLARSKITPCKAFVVVTDAFTNMTDLFLFSDMIDLLHAVPIRVFVLESEEGELALQTYRKFFRSPLHTAEFLKVDALLHTLQTLQDTLSCPVS